MSLALNCVPFVSVHDMMRLVNAVGVERFLAELAARIEQDFGRWEVFDKTPRVCTRRSSARRTAIRVAP